MDFSEIVMNRYAAKKFGERKIEPQKLGRILEMIRFAPSSFNLQPWKIIVIESGEMKNRLLPAAYNQPQITGCSHLLVFCADTDIENLVGKMQAEMQKTTSQENIDPYLQMMNKFFSNLTGDQKLNWAKNQVYIAMGNALNGAKSLGVDSCPMEGFDPFEFAKILNVSKNLTPTVLVALGYADDVPKPKLRFDKKEVFCNENAYS